MQRSWYPCFRYSLGLLELDPRISHLHTTHPTHLNHKIQSSQAERFPKSKLEFYTLFYIINPIDEPTTTKTLHACPLIRKLFQTSTMDFISSLTLAFLFHDSTSFFLRFSFLGKLGRFYLSHHSIIFHSILDLSNCCIYSHFREIII